MRDALVDMKTNQDPLQATPPAPLTGPGEARTKSEREMLRVQRHETLLRKPRLADFGSMRLGSLAAFVAIYDKHGLRPLGEAEYVVIEPMAEIQSFPFRLGVYRASTIETGGEDRVDREVLVGGPQNVRYHCDFRKKPTRRGYDGGISLDKRRLFDFGLDMVEAMMRASRGDHPVVDFLEIPPILARFEDVVPVAEPTRFVTDLVLRMLLPQYAGPPFPSTKSRGGVVEEIVTAQEIGMTYISYTDDGLADELPAEAILLPAVERGTRLDPEAVMADMVPRGTYRSWSDLESQVRPKTLQWLMNDAVAAHSPRITGGTVVDVRSCPSQLRHVRTFYEQPGLRPGEIQVVRRREMIDRLQFTQDGLIVDLRA